MITLVATGERFQTQVVPVKESDIEIILSTKWDFDWISEMKKSDRTVYKLITVLNPNVIHGLVSFEIRKEFVFLYLVESVSFNRGKEKIFFGTPTNLFAFACLQSFKKKLDGIVVFDSKTLLIEYYIETLGAKRLGGLRMVVDTPEAVVLVKRHYS